MERPREWTLEYEPLVAPGPSGQEAFHQDRELIRYRALYGGTRGGKTFSSVAEILAVSLIYPSNVHLACAPTIGDCKDILYPVFEEHLAMPHKQWSRHPIVADWHQTDRVLTFRNRSTVKFFGLMDEDPGEGTTVNSASVTEPRLVRNWEGVWKSLTRRLSRRGFQGAWVDTHSPTKELVDEWEAKNDPRYKVYRWSTHDAYEAGVIGKEYYEDTVGRYHGARAKAVLGGEYARPEGLVYAAFDPSRHVAPAPEKHKIDRMSYGVDWGYTHAACITAWAWQGDKPHGVEEYWRRYKHTSDLIEEAKRLEAKWGRGRWWCGHDEPGSIQQFKDSGFRASKLPPAKRKVKDGCTQINDLFHSGALHIAPGMSHLLEEIDMYANKEGKDEPEDNAPDAVDSMRYGLYGEMRTGKGFAAGS